MICVPEFITVKLIGAQKCAFEFGTVSTVKIRPTSSSQGSIQETWMYCAIHWNLPPCSSVEAHKCLRGMYCPHLQGQKVNQADNREEAGLRAAHDGISTRLRTVIICILHRQTCQFIKKEPIILG
jgi:hypothetical protein